MLLCIVMCCYAVLCVVMICNFTDRGGGRKGDCIAPVLTRVCHIASQQTIQHNNNMKKKKTKKGVSTHSIDRNIRELTCTAPIVGKLQRLHLCVYVSVSVHVRAGSYVYSCVYVSHQPFPGGPCLLDRRFHVKTSGVSGRSIFESVHIYGIFRCCDVSRCGPPLPTGGECYATCGCSTDGRNGHCRG